MFEFAFGVDDLATTRLTYSPLQEAVFSLRARRRPAAYPHYRRWTASWEAAYRELDAELLDALVTPRVWVPDFLTPRPAGRRPSFESELAVLAATDPAVVAKDFAAAYRGDGAPLPPALAARLEDPAGLLAHCVEQVRGYWERCLLPRWWPRARAVLEADLAHRGRMFAEHGAEGLFAGLSPQLSWNSGVLRLDDPDSRVRALGGRYTPVAGRGLILLPTLCGRGAHTVIDPDEPPVISYPARGTALLGEHPAPQPPDALAELIGPARTRLLLLLEHPATTTALAHRLAVTPGAVSRHLTALTAAGLLTRTRTGRSVLYARSPLGTALASGRL
ncbi:MULTISPECIES: ArsR family transcriptional regulator [Kitasatospora]|uniref:Putative ArsR family transcriptional regulator n=1 Tax=Kitasatospora setae (strain ATCC 33774 / DSM 43861 / JCM 3304 / KCC A-0304 / NBRC 14216 / KM-6054) TaxID=452652 RepID=E4N1Q6_KITSK|nr:MULTISPECIES: ArsR family transcriptional regulator [Kitasatospora]BAJ32090.1 putative ArsR family transcriptional regulator [Kitasatospora setae KM-6054]